MSLHDVSDVFFAFLLARHAFPLFSSPSKLSARAQHHLLYCPAVIIGSWRRDISYVGTFAALVFSCENSRSDHLPAADTVNLVSTPTVLIYVPRNSSEFSMHYVLYLQLPVRALGVFVTR